EGGTVWSDPVMEQRPPISAQVPSSPDASDPSVTDPRTQATQTTSPDTADTADRRRNAYVSPFHQTRSVEYYAVGPESLPGEAVAAVRRIDGVEKVLTVDAARVEIDGEPTSVLGVNPSSFRNHAPEPSAKSDDIWQGVAEGRIALSNDV